MEDQIFQQFQNASRQQLASVTPDNTKSFTDIMGTFAYTLVARPNRKLIETIASIQKKLRLLDGNHYYYPEDRLHLTIVGGISPTYSQEKLVGIFENICKNLVLSFECSGSASNTSAISLSFYPKGFSLHELRERIRQDVGEKGTDFSIWIPAYEYVGWMNFVRYIGKPKSELLGEIGCHREESFGEFTFSRFDLLKTSGLVLNPEWTELIHSYGTMI